MSEAEQDIYSQLCAEYYDLDKPSAQSDALVFYMKYVAEAKGRILEPMCGSGRFLIPIMEEGIEIDGFDVSPHMLDACRINRLPEFFLRREYLQALVRISKGTKAL